MFKRNRVIMLPTNEKAKIGDIIQCNNPHKSRIAWKNKLGICSFHDDENVITEWQPIHLHIISNEEINEGDWALNPRNPNGDIVKCNESNCLSIQEHWRKIIATTDKSLGLPEPSQSFIQKYIFKNNEGNEIKKVMVEYEPDYVLRIFAKIEHNSCYGLNQKKNVDDMNKLYDRL